MLDIPTGATPDDVYDALNAWITGQGLEAYQHQDEAIMELLSGNNVILSTPTGSGKSLVALAGLAANRALRGAHAAGEARRGMSARWRG